MRLEPVSLRWNLNCLQLLCRQLFVDARQVPPSKRQELRYHIGELMIERRHPCRLRVGRLRRLRIPKTVRLSTPLLSMQDLFGRITQTVPPALERIPKADLPAPC